MLHRNLSALGVASGSVTLGLRHVSAKANAKQAVTYQFIGHSIFCAIAE